MLELAVLRETALVNSQGDLSLNFIRKFFFHMFFFQWASDSFATPIPSTTVF